MTYNLRRLVSLAFLAFYVWFWTNGLWAAPRWLLPDGSPRSAQAVLRVVLALGGCVLMHRVIDVLPAWVRAARANNNLQTTSNG